MHTAHSVLVGVSLSEPLTDEFPTHRFVIDLSVPAKSTNVSGETKLTSFAS